MGAGGLGGDRVNLVQWCEGVVTGVSAARGGSVVAESVCSSRHGKGCGGAMSGLQEVV